MHSANNSYNTETSAQGATPKANNTVGNFLTAMKRGLKAATAAQTCKFDKEAMLKMLSEDNK